MLIVHPVPLPGLSLEHWVAERAARATPERTGERGRIALRGIGSRRAYCARNPVSPTLLPDSNEIESPSDAPDLAAGLEALYVTEAVDRELQCQLWMWAHSRSTHYRSIVTELNGLGCRLADIVLEAVTGAEPAPREHLHPPAGSAWFDEEVAGLDITARVENQLVLSERQGPLLEETCRLATAVRNVALAAGAASPRRARELRHRGREHAEHAVEALRELSGVSPEPGVHAGRTVSVRLSWYRALDNEGFSGYVVPNLLARRLGRHAVAHLMRLTVRTASLREWRYRSVAAEAYASALHAVMSGVRQVTVEAADGDGHQ